MRIFRAIRLAYVEDLYAIMAKPHVLRGGVETWELAKELLMPYVGEDWTITYEEIGEIKASTKTGILHYDPDWENFCLFGDRVGGVISYQSSAAKKYIWTINTYNRTINMEYN